MYDAPYLLNLLKTEGVEEGLKMVDIEQINNHTVKTIFRTVAYGNKRIIEFLEQVVKNPKLLE